MRKFSKMKCINCGQLGHTRKVCKEPKTSFGILALHIDDVNSLLNSNLVDNKKEKIKSQHSLHTRILKNVIEYLQNQSSIIDNPVIINGDNDFLNKFTEVKKNVKVLLIMRKHTLGYMEFMRGHYNINNIHQLKNLFQQMTPKEIKIISEHINNFDYLWRYLWSINENTREKIILPHVRTPSPQETQSLNSNEVQSFSMNNSNDNSNNSNSTNDSANSKRSNSFFENYEYEQSKINFEKLRNETTISLRDIINLTKSQYDFPE